jgi:hypothetical protein
MTGHIKKLGLMGVSALALSLFIGSGNASATTPDQHQQNWQQQQAHVQTADYRQDQQNKHELHMKLDASLREHAALGTAYLKAAYLNEPDVAALAAAVEQNNMTIIHTVGTAYPWAHDEFAVLWNAHIGYYKEYLTAAAKGDEAGKYAAKEKLAGFAWQVTNLLTVTNHDTLDWEQTRMALVTHGEQVTHIINYFVAGQYDAAWTTAHEAYEHMGMVAHALAMGAPQHQY